MPTPGPQTGRYASEPESGLTSLEEFDSGHTKYNASVQLAKDLGDGLKRIDRQRGAALGAVARQGRQSWVPRPRAAVTT